MGDDEVIENDENLETEPEEEGEPQQPPAGSPPAPTKPVVGRAGTVLTVEAVSARVKRERSKFLRDTYGTDDEKEVERIKAERAKDLEELANIRKANEEKKRAEQSEIDRLKSDLQKSEAKVAELEGQINSLKQESAIERQGFKVRSIASNYVRATRIRMAMNEFREYVSELPREQQKKLDDRAIEKWFKEFVKDNADFGHESRSTTPPDDDTAEDPKPPVRRPATGARPPVRLVAGARAPARVTPPKPNNAPPGTGGKTLKPGQKNSMTKDEARAEAKKMGYKLP